MSDLRQADAEIFRSPTIVRPRLLVGCHPPRRRAGQGIVGNSPDTPPWRALLGMMYHRHSAVAANVDRHGL